MNPLKHVAIIMDGNGRWGLKHKNSRNAGHKAGLNTVETHSLLDFLKSYCSQEVVDIFVVGLPKQMNNSPSESEKLIKPFLESLKNAFPNTPIEREDERFTSKMAFQSMLYSGIKKKQRQNKAMVDEISATLILQSYLNRK